MVNKVKRVCGRLQEFVGIFVENFKACYEVVLTFNLKTVDVHRVVCVQAAYSPLYVRNVFVFEFTKASSTFLGQFADFL